MLTEKANSFVFKRKSFLQKPLQGPRINRAFNIEKEQNQLYLLQNLYMHQEPEVLNM